MRFVAENPQTIRQKVAVVCEHLNRVVLPAIDHRGRAMLVTSSRQQAVTYRREVDAYLGEHGVPWRAIVAFSGTVDDEATGEDCTETSMNGFPDAQTAAKLATDPYRLLIVANKFQTGFDQPLLHTMYVDKKLAGVNAVQTLSRLNRVLPPHKEETCIVDFADNAEAIRDAFSRFYTETTLAGPSDPDDLYNIEGRLKQYGFFFPPDVEAFAKAYYRVRDHVQDMIDTNFKFFKQINDKPEFAAFLNDLLFDRYAGRKAGESPIDHRATDTNTSND